MTTVSPLQPRFSGVYKVSVAPENRERLTQNLKYAAGQQKVPMDIAEEVYPLVDLPIPFFKRSSRWEDGPSKQVLTVRTGKTDIWMGKITRFDLAVLRGLQKVLVNPWAKPLLASQNFSNTAKNLIFAAGLSSVLIGSSIVLLPIKAAVLLIKIPLMLLGLPTIYKHFTEPFKAFLPGDRLSQLTPEHVAELLNVETGRFHRTEERERRRDEKQPESESLLQELG